MEPPVVHYFGYGSLVNRLTRPPAELAWPARLHGWRRVWDHRVPASAARPGCTSLSVRPSPGSSIDGVVVALRVDELAGLDAREANYDRLALPAAAFSLPAELVPALGSTPVEACVHVYRSRLDRRAFADDEHPILASYADVVMGGYHALFGEAGLRDMLCSTDGWHGARRDDRAAPGYPRALPFDPAAQARFDSLLADALRRAGAGATIPDFDAEADGPSTCN